MKNQIRQGDVLLEEIDITQQLEPTMSSKLSENESLKDKVLITKDKKVLAYGEKTGHSHILTGDVNFYNTGNNQIICQVNSNAQLIHEEHGNIDVPKGDYIVIIQREFDAVRGIRTVMD